MKISCTPDEGTVKTNIIQRTIGRAVSVNTGTDPFGPATQDLLGDTFHSLYGMDFVPLKDEEVSKSRLVNHALMKWLSKDEEFMQARASTSGKLILSLISSKTLYEYLMTDEAIREALRVQDEPPQPPPMGGMGGGQDENKQASSESTSDSEGGGSGAGQNEEQQDSLQKALDRLKQLQNNVIGSQIISNAAREAEKSAKEAENTLVSWGINPGDVTVTDIDDIMSLVDHNSSNLERIAELAGRFENVCANALQSTREAYVGQVVDVARTQDFKNIFGTELCYLMSTDVPPLIHKQYVSDFISHGLLGFEIHAEGKEFGSLFVMVDGSGSMNPREGGFEIQAKAIALGLARALKKDKLSGKEYKLCTFGSYRDPFFYVNSNDDMMEHFRWAEKFQNGGTDFDNAFREALRNLEKMPDGTDFVFITDGECSLSVDMRVKWNKYKARTNARLLYVDVSGYNNNELRSLSDLYLKVKFDAQGNMDTIAENLADSLATSIERSRLAKLDEGDKT